MARTALPSHVWLHIAEQADLQTLSALLRTSKGLHGLITRYELSICKSKTQTYMAMFPGGEERMGLIGLESHGQRVYRPWTFGSAKEIERRERRIGELIKSDFLSLDSPCSLGLTQEQLQQMRNHTERALHIADFIADIAADWTVRMMREDADATDRLNQRRDSGIEVASEFECEDAQDKCDSDRPSHVDRYIGTIPVTTCPLSPLPVLIRHAQIDHLNNALGPVDLAFLYQLAGLAGEGYAQSLGALRCADPAAACDLITAFRETTLRHGSSLVWVLAKGTDAEADFARRAVEETCLEAQAWEAISASLEGGDTNDTDEEQPNQEQNSSSTQEDTIQIAGDESPPGSQQDNAGRVFVGRPMRGLNMTILQAFAKQANVGRENAGWELLHIIKKCCFGENYDQEGNGDENAETVGDGTDSHNAGHEGDDAAQENIVHGV